MLVAPPSPSELPVEIEPFFPVPLERSAVARIARSTRIVSADDDPFCREGAQATYADPLDVPLDIIPGGAHLSTDDGYGPWPAVEAWCLTGKFTTAVRRRLP
jgi:predicted alpha/beta hydrolase family esterase